MRRPAEVDALVAFCGYRDAVTEAENGWWSFCPVPHQNGAGPVHCGEPLFFRLDEDGHGRFEPVCGHSVAEIVAAVASVAPATDARPRQSQNGKVGPSHLTDFTEIVAKPVRWAWQDRVALAKITALAGRPKIGKGLLSRGSAGSASPAMAEIQQLVRDRRAGRIDLERLNDVLTERA